MDFNAGEYERAFLWEKGGGMIDLGTLSGGTSGAYGINDSGQGGSDGYAFLWEDGTMYDLNDLLLPGSGWTLSIANAINASGQIVGLGYTESAVQSECPARQNFEKISRIKKRCQRLSCKLPHA